MRVGFQLLLLFLCFIGCFVNVSLRPPMLSKLRLRMPNVHFRGTRSMRLPAPQKQAKRHGVGVCVCICMYVCVCVSLCRYTLQLGIKAHHCREFFASRYLPKFGVLHGNRDIVFPSQSWILNPESARVNRMRHIRASCALVVFLNLPCFWPQKTNRHTSASFWALESE